MHVRGLSPVLATVVLDSGAFLTDEASNGNLYSEVGYFDPQVFVADHETTVRKLDLGPLGNGTKIEIRHTDAQGKDLGTEIKLSNCVTSHFLRLHKICQYPLGPANPAVFDCIFHFNSGRFRCSAIKDREFRAYDKVSKQPLATTKLVKEIAHDIIVLYELGPGEELQIIKNGSLLWQSSSEPTITTRFDLQILAPHDTARRYFIDAVDLGSNTEYWVANPDDPPPNWRHTGGSGG